MSKLKILVKRNVKEIVRDPLASIFCLIFPIVMLILMQLIVAQGKVVPDIFRIENYAVGICVFGYTFNMLMVAINIASDKNSEFINRIYIAPLRKTTYLLSYVIALLPIVALQTVLFFLLSLAFGLPFGWELLLGIVYLIPSAVLYISFGVLLGTLCKTEKQAGPICSVVISGTSMLGGVFMPIGDMGTFANVANLLPFSHSVEIASGVFVKNMACVYPHILWVVGYTLLIWALVAWICKIKK